MSCKDCEFLLLYIWITELGNQTKTYDVNRNSSLSELGCAFPIRFMTELPMSCSAGSAGIAATLPVFCTTIDGDGRKILRPDAHHAEKASIGTGTAKLRGRLLSLFSHRICYHRELIVLTNLRGLCPDSVGYTRFCSQNPPKSTPKYVPGSGRWCCPTIEEI